MSAPELVVEGITKVLRSGGVWAVQEYANYATQTLGPQSAAFQRVVEAIIKSWRQRGGDPDIGLRLPAMMMKHGLRVESIQPIARKPLLVFTCEPEPIA